MARPRVPPSRAYEAVRSRKGRGRGAVCGAPLFQCGRVGGGVPSRTGGREWRTLACTLPVHTGRRALVPPLPREWARVLGVACPHVKGGGQGGRGGAGGNGERGGVPLCALSAAKGEREGPGATGKGGDVTPSARMGKGGGDVSSREWEGTGREEGERAVAGTLMRTPSVRMGGADRGNGRGRRRGTADPRAPPFRANGAAACPCAALPREWDGGTWGDGRGPEGGTACPRAPHFYANGVARTGGRVGGGIPSGGGQLGERKEEGGLPSCAHFLRSNGAAVNAGEGEEGGRLTLGRRPVLLRPLST
ncbi:hypothetical protein EDB85DRAFT_1969519 [Lactarius pseudohatsudake]|nr:hypothetical protein EDB85DRAFT_1969519 [Lactarius pseudohatsudake]